MKFQLMRYHFEQNDRLMLDLFDFRTNQNIEVYIYMKYWHAGKKSILVVNDILRLLSIKNVEHTLDGWYAIVREYLCFTEPIKECVNYADDSTKGNK